MLQDSYKTFLHMNIQFARWDFVPNFLLKRRAFSYMVSSYIELRLISSSSKMSSSLSHFNNFSDGLHWPQGFWPSTRVKPRLRTRWHRWRRSLCTFTHVLGLKPSTPMTWPRCRPYTSRPSKPFSPSIWLLLASMWWKALWNEMHSLSWPRTCFTQWFRPRIPRSLPEGPSIFNRLEAGNCTVCHYVLQN